MNILTIQNLLKEKNLSIYRLSKISEVPYATCNDIVSGKAQLEKCSAETIYKLAHALNTSMEDILSPCFEKRSSFENFKSSICHRVKELGDTRFIIETLENDNIRKYYDKKWYPESLYLLGMLDYISRENDIPLCDEYDDIRKCRLDRSVYPSSVLALSAASKDNAVLTHASDTAIPEFKRFNIIENEVRNVV